MAARPGLSAARTTEIDRALWAAHLHPELTIEIPVDPEEWAIYVAKLGDESERFWHGLTGGLAARLGLEDSPEWERFVDLERQRWGSSGRLGSLEEVYRIAKKSGLKGFL